MRTLAFLIGFSLCALAQNPNTAKFPTSVATDQDLLVGKDLSSSTLTAGIGAGDTAIPVADGTKFTGYEVVTIDQEQILICSVNANTLNVCSGGRGFGGTTAATHSNGAQVRGNIVAWHHNQLAAEIKAIESNIGSPMAAALGDLIVRRDSATQLTIGPACSTAKPCNIRFGSTTTRITTNAVVTLTSGTGTAYVYVTSAGVLTVGHNVTLACDSHCTAVSGVTTWPADVIPLWRIDAVSGAWDTGGGLDFRAFLANRVITTGVGLSMTGDQITVDSASVPFKGAGYAASKAIATNANGDLVAVSGNATDCVLVNGTSAACGGSGAVTSVFGRTGAVVAQTGDYSFSQISGTVANSQIASGVDATKIGSGTVSNTVFGYLANVVSDIQTQLNGKAATSHTHTLGGDVTGDIASTTVGKLQGRAVASTAPSDAQALVWSASNSQWQPGTVSGSGATMASALGDLTVRRDSATQLTIGPACSASTPCNIRFGSTTTRITASAVVTLTSGTGTAYVYVTSAGVLTVGHNVTLACDSHCTAVSGVTTWPADVIPLWRIDAVSGAWDSGGGLDYRAFQSNSVYSAGTGLTQTGNQFIVDSASVPFKGSGYAASKALAADSSGNVVAVSGSDTNCVLVNGTSAACGSGGGVSYFDHTVFHEVEEFCGTTDAAVAIGTQTRWGTAGIGGGSAIAAANTGDAKNICTARLGTGSSVGQGTGFYEYPTGQIANPNTNYLWQVEYIFALEYSNTNIRIRVGLADQANTITPSNFVGLRFDTNAGDTAFMYQTCASGTCTTTSSGVTPATMTYYRVRMRGTATGTWAFCLNACSSETTINTNVPTAALTPAVMIATDTTAGKYMQVDKFEIQRTGLSRY